MARFKPAAEYPDHPPHFCISSKTKTSANKALVFSCKDPNVNVTGDRRDRWCEKGTQAARLMENYDEQKVSETDLS